MSQKLSEHLIYWRVERPSEWLMDEFIRDATKLENDVTALRRGNTQLLESLMWMVDQFFYSKIDSDVLNHSFMSAEEGAIQTLLDAGFAEEAEGGYRLLWEKLEERKCPTST